MHHQTSTNTPSFLTGITYSNQNHRKKRRVEDRFTFPIGTLPATMKHPSRAVGSFQNVLEKIS